MVNRRPIAGEGVGATLHLIFWLLFNLIVKRLIKP